MAQGTMSVQPRELYVVMSDEELGYYVKAFEILVGVSLSVDKVREVLPVLTGAICRGGRPLHGKEYLGGVSQLTRIPEFVIAVTCCEQSRRYFESLKDSNLPVDLL